MPKVEKGDMLTLEEPQVIKSIAVDAVLIVGEEDPVALVTLADADGGKAEYLMSDEGARMMITAMEAYLATLKPN